MPIPDEAHLPDLGNWSKQNGGRRWVLKAIHRLYLQKM